MHKGGGGRSPHFCQVIRVKLEFPMDEKILVKLIIISVPCIFWKCYFVGKECCGVLENCFKNDGISPDSFLAYLGKKKISLLLITNFCLGQSKNKIFSQGCNQTRNYKTWVILGYPLYLCHSSVMLFIINPWVEVSHPRTHIMWEESIEILSFGGKMGKWLKRKGRGGREI